MKQKNLFIDSLVSDFHPNKQWLPQWRSAVWLVSFLLLNILTIVWVQPFRAEFLQQLMEHKRYFFEIVSVFLFILFLAYSLFVHLVPGEKLNLFAKFLGIVSLVIFITTLVLSFHQSSPPETYEGARHCVDEILIYGFVGLLTFLYFIRKIHLKISIFNYMQMGILSALIPGAFMELACMYSPMHALMWHYGPVLVLASIGLIFGAIKNVRPFYN